MVEYFLIILGVGLLFLGTIDGMEIQERRMDTLVCLLAVLVFTIALLIADLIDGAGKLARGARKCFIRAWSKIQKTEYPIDDDR